MSKDAKLIRGQVRQVVKEILADILSQEMKGELYGSLRGEIVSRLTLIETNVRDKLNELDERQKDSLGYLMRHASAPAPEATPSVVAGEPTSE